jgi:hypothetical protein
MKISSSLKKGLVLLKAILVGDYVLAGLSMPDKGKYPGALGYGLGHVADNHICIKTIPC